MNDDLERLELPEPRCYVDSIRLEREVNNFNLPNCGSGYLNLTTYRNGDQDQPLFTADQLRAAILADRQRHVDAPNTSERCVKESADFAHEIWAAAQLVPGEGIADGVGRISALLAERAQAAEPVPMNWQTIETAPHGTMCLFCSMETADVTKWCFVDWIAGGGFMLHKTWTATHWAPLPKAPEAALGGGG